MESKKRGRPFGIKGDPEMKGTLKPALYSLKDNAVEVLLKAETDEGRAIAKSFVASINDLIYICIKRRMF